LAHRGAARLNLVGNATNQRALTALRAVGGEILLHVLRHGSVSCAMAETLRLAGVAEHTRWLTHTPLSEADYALAYDELSLLCRRAGRECPITITTDLAAGLRDARYVLTATSAGRSFITPETFMHDAVVCDVARPLDVANRLADARSDLLIYEGGLMRLPNNMRFGSLNVLGYPDGINLACLSESMVLALEGVSGHHSLGNRIDYAQALRILQLAHKHGFDPLLGPLPTHEVAAALPRAAAQP
jgi:predicted amino acid dehydrogenase